MLERLYLVIEIIAIIFCACGVFGKKFRFDLATIVFIAVEVFTLQLIDIKDIPYAHDSIVYIELFVYCIVEFKCDIWNLLFGYCIVLFISIVLQTICSIPFLLVSDGTGYLIMYWLVNIVFMGTAFLLYKKFPLYKYLNRFLNQYKIEKIVVSLGIGAIVLLFYYQAKYAQSFDFTILLECAVVMGVTMFLLYRWKDADYRWKQSEMERQMNQMYNGAFQDLVDTTRMQQHDFKNHLQALLSIAETAVTREEVGSRQKEYCEEVIGMLQCSDLLYKVNTHPLAGFLHHKIRLAQQQGIDVFQHISVNECEIGIPLHEVVEILGIFMDNACEAVTEYSKERKKIQVDLTELEGALHLVISNPVDFRAVEEFAVLVEKGKSTKGKDRGFGLAKIESYCRRYDMIWSVNVCKKEEGNWLEISMDIKNNRS